MLALGTHLVNELGLSDSTDTLGRWLAHHLAELISEADSASGPKSRREASRRATDTILKLWAHRRDLPGAATPLAPFREILEFASGLLERSSYWDGFQAGAPASIRLLWHRFCRVMLGLILVEMAPSKARRKSTNKIVRQFLESSEGELLDLLEQRFVLIEETQSGKSRESAHPASERDRVRDNTKKLIEKTITDLQGHLKRMDKSAPADSVLEQ